VIPEPLSNESPEVPEQSWIYVAFFKLVSAGVAEPMYRNSSPAILTVTRYQFAVAIARLLDKKKRSVPKIPLK